MSQTAKNIGRSNITMLRTELHLVCWKIKGLFRGSSKGPFGVFLLYVFLIFLGYWEFHIPVPGFSVAALGVAAAIMAVLGELKVLEKVAWILLLFGFLSLELSSIDNDRARNEAIRVLARAQEAKSFSDIGNGIKDSIEKSQRQFGATMGEVEGSSGYVYFLVLAGNAAELSVMMVNNNTAPVRGVDLEIITMPEKESPDELNQLAFSTFHPRLVHIGDVSPGFKQAQFTLGPGKYNIRIMTRLAAFNEYLEVVRGPSVPNGWREESCVIKNNSARALYGKCPW